MKEGTTVSYCWATLSGQTCFVGLQMLEHLFEKLEASHTPYIRPYNYSIFCQGTTGTGAAGHSPEARAYPLTQPGAGQPGSTRHLHWGQAKTRM